MGKQFFVGNIKQVVPNAALNDILAPTFAGLNAAVANADGSITASWLAATDATNPVRYSVYIQAGTATGIFVNGNRIYSIFGLSAKIYTDAAGAALVNGTTYHLGVRALDALGNAETNVVTISAVSQGVPSNSLFNLITAIKAKTDVMTFDGSNYLNVHTKVNDDKTDYTISNTDKNVLVAKIWNELQAGYTTAGTFGFFLNEIVGSRGAQTDINTLLARLTNTRALLLDNLDAAMTSRAPATDTATLLTRLSPGRAALLDNLDVAISTRASQGSVNNIQNNTSFVGVVQTPMLLPPTGSKVYPVYVRIFNDSGAPVDADSNTVNFVIKDSAGAIVQASAAMTRNALGQYSASYTVQSTDTERPLYFFFNYAVNSVAFDQVRSTEVQEFETKLDALMARLTPTRASNLDNLDAPITSVATAADMATLLVRLSATRALLLDNLDVAVSTRALDSTVAKDATVAKDSTVAKEATLAGVKSKTDLLNFLGANVLAQSDVVTDKTDYALSSTGLAALADAVWDELLVAHSTPDSAGRRLTDANNSLSGGALESTLQAVKAKSDLLAFDTGRVIAKSEVVTDKVNYTIDSADQDALVDKIMEEPLSGHTTVGTPGEALNNADVPTSSRADQSSLNNFIRFPEIIGVVEDL